MIDLPILRQLGFPIQWNPSKTDTIGTNDFVCHSEVSLAQGVVIDHARPTITASYDKAWLWTMKKTVLMRGLLTDSSYLGLTVASSPGSLGRGEKRAW